LDKKYDPKIQQVDFLWRKPKSIYTIRLLVIGGPVEKQTYYEYNILEEP
jgi:hypothetical protein